jgi:tetratricopeptide (TPR) repeat protein
MLELPSVTLCCIDTVNPALALRALRISSSGIRFARTLLLSDRGQDTGAIELRQITHLASREEYSAFVLKSLLPHVDTPHVLLIQWDGYVVNPLAWHADFLACDYIGAKWFWHQEGYRVGNGGFSLRSRKLLAALQDPRITLSGAEDETICRAFRPLLEREHGIVFASEALADAFAFEAAYPIAKPFGFHGLYNFCRVMPPQELAELAGLFTPAIARSPQLLQLGRNCMALGQWRPAAAIFGRILAEQPDHAEARASLAVAGRSEAAAPLAGRNDPCPCGSGKRYKHCHGAESAAAADGGAAVAAAPSLAQRLQQAVAWHERGDVEAALATYREVLAQQPDNAVALHFLGVIHYQRRNLAEALPLLERAVRLQPDEPEFHNNLGLALAAADREEEAIAAYRRALALKPDHAGAWSNLGLTLQSLNDIDGAIDAYRRALALNPGLVHARWNLALALLVDRRFDEGWRAYEARLELPELGKHRHRYPGARWEGASLEGKTLLLYPEQGLGDALQFARYATIAAAHGARCLIRCSQSLRQLLASVPGVAGVSGDGEPLPSYDVHSPLLSLPRFFRTGSDTIPASVPYLSVRENTRDAARAKLASVRGKRRVGLAWAGNPAQANDRNRSTSLAKLAPLLEVPGIAWFSLQQGERATEIASTPGGNALTPLAPDATLDDTAGLVTELDLVVSVDTMIAHLAGALARPVWILLCFAADWRWELGREDSPWYPTARLFRQARPHDWSALVARVADELRAWASAR